MRCPSSLACLSPQEQSSSKGSMHLCCSLACLPPKTIPAVRGTGALSQLSRLLVTPRPEQQQRDRALVLLSSLLATQDHPSSEGNWCVVPALDLACHSSKGSVASCCSLACLLPQDHPSRIAGSSTEDMLIFAQISTCVLLIWLQQHRLKCTLINLSQDLSVCRPSTSQWLRLHRGIMNLCGPDASRGDCKTMLCRNCHFLMGSKKPQKVA